LLYLSRFSQKDYHLRGTLGYHLRLLSWDGS